MYSQEPSSDVAAASKLHADSSVQPLTNAREWKTGETSNPEDLKVKSAPAVSSRILRNEIIIKRILAQVHT